MRIFLPWSTFKQKITTNSYLRHDDRDSFYLLEYPDLIGTIITSIKKDNGNDHLDFENNYKSKSNTSFTPNLLDDGRTISTTNRIPSGFTLCPTSRGDDIENGVYGTGPKIVLDGTTPGITDVGYMQFKDNIYGIGGRAIWEGATLDDSVDVILIAPATTGATQTTGDYTKVEVIPSSGKHVFVPTNPGQGDWSLDLASKLNPNVNILKCTPVPVPGNTGFFDYNSDTNTLSINSSQNGGYNLYDFDISLTRLANSIPGKKTDGSETMLESSDVVGKLIYNSWKFNFKLNAITQGVRVGVVLTVAAKKTI